MRELITRLEAATGPDRILDGDVWWITLSEELKESFDSTGYIRKVIEREGSPGKALNQFFDSARKPPSLLDYPPNVTASLDAAVALVERLRPGWTIASIGQDDKKTWHAELRQGYLTSYSTVALAGALTPAIALLIATLKALEVNRA